MDLYPPTTLSVTLVHYVVVVYVQNGIPHMIVVDQEKDQQSVLDINGAVIHSDISFVRCPSFIHHHPTL